MLTAYSHPPLCSQLSEDQAAALLDDSRRTRYLDCCAAAAPSGGSQGGEQGPAVAGDVLRQWPQAALQATDGARLPQVGFAAWDEGCACRLAPWASSLGGKMSRHELGDAVLPPHCPALTRLPVHLPCRRRPPPTCPPMV